MNNIPYIRSEQEFLREFIRSSTVPYLHGSLPVSGLATIVTFANDTAILSSNVDPKLFFLQLEEMVNWVQIWRMKANESEFVKNLQKGNRKIMINNIVIPQLDDV